MGDYINPDDILRASQAMGLQNSQPGPQLASNGNLDFAGLDRSMPVSQPPIMKAPAVAPPPPSAPADSPASDEGSPLDQFRVTKEELQNAAEAKRKDAGLGMIADALGNRQSWGNFYSGKMNGHHDYGDITKQWQSQEDEPIKQKQALLKQTIEAPQQEMQLRMSDPNSGESKISRSISLAGIAELKELSPAARQEMADAVKGASAMQISALAEKNPLFAKVLNQDSVGQKMLMMGQMFQQRQDNFQQSLGLREQGLGLRNNAAYGKEMGQTESQLLAANKALAIANGIKSGDLVGTSQIKSDLAAALGSMMNGGKPATVYGMSHQDFDSLYARAQHSYGILTGQTPGTITDAQLTQLQKDIGALQNEYSKQREIKFNALKAGTPEGLQDQSQKRYDAFSKGVSDKDSAGGGAKMSDDDKAALQHIKDNPGGPDNAAILNVLRKKYGNQVQ